MIDDVEAAEALARQVAAAEADRLDLADPGWALRCDPALAPHDRAAESVWRTPEADHTALIGAWMREIAQRRAG